MTETEQNHKPGDDCTRSDCGGRLVVHHSTLSRKHRVQRLRCNACGKKHGKFVCPNELAQQVAALEERIRKLEESALESTATIKNVL